MGEIPRYDASPRGRFIICRGIPGSGKSTWAREWVRKSKGSAKRVNRDDLRAMIDDSIWSRDNEAHINTLRNMVMAHFLDAGKDVIVDDTNIPWVKVLELANFATRCRPNITVYVQTFDTPLEVCLERNAMRSGAAHVPEDVIRKFYKELQSEGENITYPRLT